MPATSTSPVKILLDLGIDLDNLSSEEDYLSALMEASAMLQASGQTDQRFKILTDEVRAVRKSRKAAAPSKGMKITQKKISAASFKAASIVKKPSQGIGNVLSPVKEDKGGDLLVIKEKVISIAALLGDQYKLKEDQAKDARKLRERKGRKLSENLLEGGKKVWEGVKKTGEKILAPFQSVWKNILGFIEKIIVGRVLFKILEWAGDPKNQDKIKSIGKFFNDFWPVMLAGYLLFGNSLTSMVTGMLIQMGKWLAPMLLAIGKLMLNPWVLAAMGTGAAIYAIGKTIGKDKEGENIAEATNESTEAIVDEGNMDEGEAGVLSQSVTTENVDRMTQGDTNIRSNNNMLQTGMDDPLSGGRLGLNKGGPVPGSGNTDTVPAMLTPGEFVMSKGAVQKYGSDTLAGMNAAAGGTNKPTLMGGYNEGGFANITNTETTSSSDSYGNFSVGKRYVAPGEAKERIAEMGMPSMELMDGTVVPDFGKMGGESVTQGLQLTRDIMVENGAPPEKIAQLDEVMSMPDAQPESIALMVNRLVPGSMENTMMNVGDSITASARMNGGGLVPIQGLQGGGQVRRLQMGIGATPVKNIPTITPPEKKKTTVVYQEQGGSMKSSNNKLPPQTNKEVPSFSAIAMRSPDKINVLGISV